MNVSFSCKLKKFKDTRLWSFYIEVPDNLSKQLITKDRRVFCELNGIIKFQAALMPSSLGFYFININKEIRTKLKIDQGSEISVVLTKDTSEYGIYVPDFFTELCYQDPDGKKYFHQLTPGKQRSLLHYIGKPKSEQKQLEKALIVFDYLKSVNGNLDFKELMEAFKNNRLKSK